MVITDYLGLWLTSSRPTIESGRANACAFYAASLAARRVNYTRGLQLSEPR